MTRTNDITRRLQIRFNEIQPALNADEPFTIQDFEQENMQQVLRFLSENGVIEEVGDYFDTEDKRYITEWEWKEVYKSKLKDYQSEVRTFPDCKHKATIHNPQWADALACPECDKEYSKEQVKEVL